MEELFGGIPLHIKRNSKRKHLSNIMKASSWIPHKHQSRPDLGFKLLSVLFLREIYRQELAVEISKPLEIPIRESHRRE